MTDMTFTLSRHARERVESRNIRLEWIERVLAEPAHIETDPIDPKLKQAFGIIAEMNGRVPRIVYNDSQGTPHVVTVHFHRRMKGRL